MINLGFFLRFFCKSGPRFTHMDETECSSWTTKVMDIKVWEC